GALRQADRDTRGMAREVLPRGHRTHASVVAQLAVGCRQEVHALEPPVTEQLGIERRDDDLFCAPAPLRLLGRDTGEQVREMTAMLTDPAERRGGFVRPLRPQIHVGTGHAPKLEPAGPADLVELEIPLVARVAVMAAPDLHG